MGTSQSKRNKISKFRTSSVGTVGELDEQDEDRILNNTGKLSSMKGIWFYSLKQGFCKNIMNKHVLNWFLFINFYFLANNNSRNSSETNKKDYTNANNGNTFLQANK